MKLTIEPTNRIRDAWIFFFSFLLVFSVEYRLFSTTFVAKPVPKPTLKQSTLLSKELKEVSAPGIVQELHNKLVLIPSTTEIIKPINGDSLTRGNWNLCLDLKDWSGSINKDSDFFNYLTMQIDDSQPLRIGKNHLKGSYLQLQLPELSIGEHHISIFSTFPWGESIKTPGAYQSIEIFRSNIFSRHPNRSNSPRLTLISPSLFTTSEPILIDWISWNTPIKDLLTKNAQWHLRLLVNNESFLIDRSVPLWLTGLHSGNNTISMEIVNEQGEIISLNTVIQEISINHSVNSQIMSNRSWTPKYQIKRVPVTNLEVPELMRQRPVAILQPNSTNQMKIVPGNELEEMLFYEEFLDEYSNVDITPKDEENPVINIIVTRVPQS